ncbi:hypothetical protein OHA40_24055 [Nocardia sp. NBC_00508]|uniref:hypothetical protein n=1 Tax=Nocardia sp. NBC_00508 TaxID=2975992 RepID=UPI002E821CC3|nr:hypothetical protein [Nocardia sp. NBC_00508]WUD64736.1 hypothetical protein OHA40_24055 [Nocardia sp. NBC_00508]
MDIHAYPTEATTPVDPTEAHRIADHYLTGDDHASHGTTYRITEFDTCFVAVAVFDGPPHADPNAPVVIVGGSVCVIDKPTGAVSYWPTYPAATVAEQYAAMLHDGRLIIEDDWPEGDDQPDNAEPSPR